MECNIDASSLIAMMDRFEALTYEEPLKAGAVDVQNDIQSNFSSQGFPRQWAPLQPVTLFFRSKRGYSTDPILIQAGKLRDSYIPGGPGNVFEVKPDSLTMGSRLPYAAFQEYGGVTAADSMIPGRPVPARPVAVVHPETPNKVAELVNTLVGHTLN